MVTVEDEAGAVGRATAAVEVGNALPTLESVAVSPEAPLRTDTVDCVVSGWFDDDGDTETVSY